jgi:hypothetical protein
MEELKAILISREALYARSETQVDTSEKTVKESLADVQRAIEEAGFMNR